MFHLRDRDGNHEIDVIIEVGAGGLVVIEIKAKASVALADARHLRWLRDQLGPAFVAGVVLHTGPRAFRLDERVLALPLWSLWSEFGSRARTIVVPARWVEAPPAEFRTRSASAG